MKLGERAGEWCVEEAEEEEEEEEERTRVVKLLRYVPYAVEPAAGRCTGRPVHRTVRSASTTDIITTSHPLKNAIRSRPMHCVRQSASPPVLQSQHRRPCDTLDRHLTHSYPTLPTTHSTQSTSARSEKGMRGMPPAPARRAMTSPSPSLASQEAREIWIGVHHQPSQRDVSLAARSAQSLAPRSRKAVETLSLRVETCCIPGPPTGFSNQEPLPPPHCVSHTQIQTLF
ncbi:uncharacterized protein J3D65DRAFT_377213 [Phyllosticta citribraziliensis]|uniref:Uncharacterized protein n=1 Tax=Phyllosticta citribraziliensis TaxID=989973 RepID=A0ABR1LS13_9PEZI